jgi:hypothetical protein
MRRIMLATVCVAAAMATCAAGPALAAPEFFTKGEPVGPKTKIAFTSSGTASSWKWSYGFECSSSTAKGDVEGEALVKEKITFYGCESPAISSSCQKSPSHPGVIDSESLTAPLTEASEKPGGPRSVVGELEPEKEGKPLAKFTCGPHKELSVIVTGALLEPIGPVGGPESKEGFVIAAEKSKEEGFGCTKQQYLFIEGVGPCVHLETGAGELWITTDETVTYRTPIEIRP